MSRGIRLVRIVRGSKGGSRFLKCALALAAALVLPGCGPEPDATQHPNGRARHTANRRYAIPPRLTNGVQVALPLSVSPSASTSGPVAATPSGIELESRRLASLYLEDVLQDHYPLCVGYVEGGRVWREFFRFHAGETAAFTVIRSKYRELLESDERMKSFAKELMEAFGRTLNGVPSDRQQIGRPDNIILALMELLPNEQERLRAFLTYSLPRPKVDEWALLSSRVSPEFEAQFRPLRATISCMIHPTNGPPPSEEILKAVVPLGTAERHLNQYLLDRGFFLHVIHIESDKAIDLAPYQVTATRWGQVNGKKLKVFIARGLAEVSRASDAVVVGPDRDYVLVLTDRVQQKALVLAGALQPSPSAVCEVLVREVLDDGSSWSDFVRRCSTWFK